ncbi:MAG: CpaF family protein [Lachnospiraceae bacterium]|jgi:pilus assembly protein CpaF|nr:CpaF family protein [Lachnospiraceae bacterium]
MEQAVKVSEYFAALKEQILERVDLSREVPDEEMQDLIDEVVLSCGREQHLTLNEKCRLKKELFHALRKMDVLQELLDEPEVTEIMVNGMDGIFLEKNGKLMRWEKNFYSRERILDVIQQMAGACNRVVNESQPIVDARLENGDRVHVVLPPVAVNGPIITIRRFPKSPITMERLLELGSISGEEMLFLKDAVRSGYSILIAGGTGSGKTTFLNALSQYIPKDERVIVIEDTAELQIQNVENLVRMETRASGVEDCREITIRDLIRASLRMRPSRIIVGEVRGAETFELLTCLNTGHDGSISTCHANSPQDTIARLETMVLMGMELPLQAIRRQIASGIDLIVYLGRLRDKSRRLLEITEVTGMEGEQVVLNPLFSFRETGEVSGRICGVQCKTGDMKNIEKLQRAGIPADRITLDKESAASGSS